MADARSLTFGIQWDIDNSPLDETDSLLDQVEESAGEAYDSVEQIGTAIQHIGTNASSAFQSVEGASTSMGASVRSAMLQSIEAGNGLGRTITAGIGAAFTSAQAKVKGFGAATKSVAKDVGNAFLHPIQTIKQTLGAALQNAQKDTKELGNEAKNTGKDLDEMGAKGAASGSSLIDIFKKAAVAIGALAIIKKITGYIKEFASAAINAAADAEEVQSKFDTVFKGSAASADVWVENFATAAKRSKNEVRTFMADSGAVFAGLGMDADAAATMSKQMTSLTYDLASFNNVADADAFAKMRSGLVGNTEGLKSLGIVLNETALNASMAEMGIKGAFNELDEATKVQVRFNAILAQSADAQQDVTRTADSYTNSLKGVKGVWADFLATAGAKFTPVLNNMFNKIVEMWPTIEPMLMGLVDLLAVGLDTAVPVLMQLGSVLLPVFAQALGVVFQVITPLIPVIGMLAQTILPPLVNILSMVVQAIMPPLVSILGVVNSILQPLMPVLQVVAQAILPPIAQLLGYIAPVLQALSPVLQFIGQILGVIGEVLGKIIGWAADGVGKVVDFFGKLFGGAKQANDEMGTLADTTASVMGATGAGSIGMPAIEAAQIPAMPEIPIPDASAYTNTISAAMDTAPIMAAESWGAASDTARDGLDEIGGVATDAYADMATQAENAWARSKDAAVDGVSVIIEQLNLLSQAAARVGTIDISTSGVRSIPHNATGDSDFGGGPTWINEGGRGELVQLPNHSTIVPADQTDRIMSSNSKSTQAVQIAPQIIIQLSGSATEEDGEAIKAQLEPWMVQLITDTLRKLQEDDSAIEALQDALA